MQAVTVTDYDLLFPEPVQVIITVAMGSSLKLMGSLSRKSLLARPRFWKLTKQRSKSEGLNSC